MIHNSENGILSFRLWQADDHIYTDRLPRAFGNFLRKDWSGGMSIPSIALTSITTFDV
jgi:hypothetical protein